MTMELKNYQRNALAALDSFFTQARGATTEAQVAAAFTAARAEALGDGAPRSLYRRFSEASPEIPLACIRIPTGGGKTLLAAHAIERAARLYVGAAYPLTLWLVPSNTIRIQTIEALQKPDHPYRQALLDHFPADRLSVIDIDDCEQLRPDDFGNRAIVVIATIQTLRVDVTASRKVYSYKEAFEPHFARLPVTEFFEKVTQADLDEQPYLKPSDIGRTKFSFANLLAFHRPIVIVDEAHNSTTPLSTETLQRVRPACIIEWTATPAKEQNVLYTVSAQELKAENMIKLPIVLSPHPNWQEAIRDAVLTRDRLAAEALNETDYIRPIVLFQAEPINREVTVDVLKTHLVENLQIDAKRIAVATGNQRELDGINLFDRACPIDFVITVEALKEGWDCSFAYVFASAQTIRQAKDMEQLLGRVLRLPYATPRASEHLNRAYAHVCAPATIEVASQLADKLISMGFEEMEAVNAVQTGGPDLFGDAVPTPQPPQPIATTVIINQKTADALLKVAGGTVQLTPDGEKFKATVTGIINHEAIDAAVAAAPAAQRDTLARDLRHHQARALKAASPRDRGAHLPAIPRLAIPLQGEMVLFEPAILADLANFSLAGRDADLANFTKEVDQAAYLIDVERSKVRLTVEQQGDQLDLNVATEGIRREDVIRTLDRKLRRHDILQPDMIAWLGRVLDGLERQKVDLTYTARHINAVADKLAIKIQTLVASAQREAFQQTLLDPARKPRLDASFDFKFPEDTYPARHYYDGKYTFKKHFYGPPGELDSDITAEETACAIEIDQLPEVEYWVRNLERRDKCSFALPTSTDNFYPDFVAFLKDGRTLVIEYKGADRYSNDDSREKRDIGGVWAAASSGRCLFAMVSLSTSGGQGTVLDQLRLTIA